MPSVFQTCINTQDNKILFALIIVLLIFAFIIYRFQINPGKPLTTKQTHDLIKNIGNMLILIGFACAGIYFLTMEINKCYNGDQPVTPNTMQNNIPNNIPKNTPNTMQKNIPKI